MGPRRTSKLLPILPECKCVVWPGALGLLPFSATHAGRKASDSMTAARSESGAPRAAAAPSE
eukprot:7039275-Lingulodinium_polyedra.AAC.1